MAVQEQLEISDLGITAVFKQFGAVR